jgi:SAM-dependent methyltransferase
MHSLKNGHRNMALCPLCGQSVSVSFKGIDNLHINRCDNCYLFFKNADIFISPDEEKHRYSHHNNTPEEPGYIKFLRQAIDPALSYLKKSWKGLDFGCGPNPVLAGIVTNEGYTCKWFDPYFFPVMPSGQFNFVFATECFEHFFDPLKEIQTITDKLNPEGILTIMTLRWNEATNMKQWWYLRDPTHVVFYHSKTIEYICSQFGYSKLFDDGEKVVVLKKSNYQRTHSIDLFEV